MANDITFVGMDVHKNSIHVALLAPGSVKPVTWSQASTAEAIRRLIRRLRREALGPIECCYEAGPTGYFLYRKLRSEQIGCTVVAPSLIPIRPGSRIKTDRRDAAKLAEMFRAGLLTEVRPPSEADEALRDLFRCRDDARSDLTRARHRMSKFLLRRNIIYRQTKHHWGTRHMAWLRALTFEDRPSQAVFESYLLTISVASPLQASSDGATSQTTRGSTLEDPRPR